MEHPPFCSITTFAAAKSPKMEGRRDETIQAPGDVVTRWGNSRRKAGGQDLYRSWKTLKNRVWFAGWTVHVVLWPDCSRFAASYMAESFLRFNLQEIVTIVPVAVGNRCPGRLTLNHQFLDACSDHQDMTSLLLNNMFLFRIPLFFFHCCYPLGNTPKASYIVEHLYIHKLYIH